MGRASSNLTSLLEGKPILDVQGSALPANNPAVRVSLDVDGFPQPPAPPPSQPLPEKPDVGRILENPLIQPMLQRTNTAKPGISSGTPGDQMQALFVLTHELKAAKDQIPDLQSRVQFLEQQLREEREARANAEERAYQLEQGSRKDSAEPAAKQAGPEHDVNTDSVSLGAGKGDDRLGTLQSQLDRLQANMVDMKQQMEAYRRRAESAETQRDEARQSLAEMIEDKRSRMDAELAPLSSLKLSRDSTSLDSDASRLLEGSANGHTIRPSQIRPVALTILLEKAGVDGDKPLTPRQAAKLQRVLRQEMLADDSTVVGARQVGLSYHGIPHAAAFTTVVVGLVVMGWLTGWEKPQR